MDEFDHRMQNWRKNHAIVEQLNKSNDGVYFADNFYSDLTDTEYAQTIGGLVPERDTIVPEPADEDRLMEFSSDGDSRRLQRGDSINWVTEGKVSPVKY